MATRRVHIATSEVFLKIIVCFFRLKKTFVLRESQDFKACGILADQSGEIKSGIKSQSPLKKVIRLPWNCPIDPMHQVFLGTGKTLSKLIVSLATNQILKKA